MKLINYFAFLLFAAMAGVSSIATADQVVRVWQPVSYSEQGGYGENGSGFIRVAYSKRAPDATAAKIIVVRKLATYWVKPFHGNGRIRITVPMQFYLSSWDVKALERELERLGVKGKPKPVPRPKPVISG